MKQKIKTSIEFTCTWPKEDVQKIFDKLINATGITDLGLSTIFIQDVEQERITEVQGVQIVDNQEQESKETHEPEPKHIETEPIDIPWPATTTDEAEESKTEQPYIFEEIDRISDKDLGPEMKTAKDSTTYAETKDGRIIVMYASSKLYTTLEMIRALPDKMTKDITSNLNTQKRAALRNIKRWITELDAREKEVEIDPYAPILTGGAKVDTRSSGKVEGDLE